MDWSRLPRLFSDGRDLFLRAALLNAFLMLTTRTATRIGAEAGAVHQVIRSALDVHRPFSRRFRARGAEPGRLFHGFRRYGRSAPGGASRLPVVVRRGRRPRLGHAVGAAGDGTGLRPRRSACAVRCPLVDLRAEPAAQRAGVRHGRHSLGRPRLPLFAQRGFRCRGGGGRPRSCSSISSRRRR